MSDAKTNGTPNGAPAPGAADRLRDVLAGEVLAPEDEGYEEARRGWSASVEQRPALIARARGRGDVARAVRFAAENGLPVGVRGTGHGQVDFEGHLLVDTSAMRGVTIDAENRRARVEAGATWGDVHRASDPFGLAAPAGQAAGVGVAGLTLGGGIGWLVRRYGATSDSLRAVDLVDARGDALRASEDEEPDLFWALRGGGGNFGVATEFEFELYPVRDVVAGTLWFPPEAIGEAFSFYREWAPGLPDGITTTLMLSQPPPDPALPDAWEGRAVAGLGVCHVGDPAEARELLRPARELSGGAVDGIGPGTYLGLLEADDAPGGMRSYGQAGLTRELSDGLVDALVGNLEDLSLPLEAVTIRQLGGAFTRVPEDATALGYRDAEYFVQVQAAWPPDEPAEERRRHVDDLIEALRPHLSPSIYLNFVLDRPVPYDVRAAYKRPTHRRLSEIKARVDPENRFRVNHNVPLSPQRAEEAPDRLGAPGGAGEDG
jgi:FAD/FMN-containing dehydrogenase